jgi:signal transduction histidine kinase
VGLRARLLLFVVLVAVLPLGLLGWAAVDVATDRLAASLEDQQSAVAEALALNLDTWLELQLRLQAQQAQTFPVARLSAPAMAGVTQVVAGQVPEAHVVTLLDEGRGQVIAPVLRAGRGGLSEVIPEVMEHLPAAAPGQTAVGSPYTPATGGGPVVVTRSPIPQSDLQLVVELALEPSLRALEAQAGAASAVLLVDADGVVFWGDPAQLPPASTLETLRGLAGVIHMRTADGSRLVALAPVPRLGWTLVVVRSARPVEDAVRDITLRMGWFALVAIAAAVVIGVWFARQLTGPIDGLSAAARAVGAGGLGAQAPAAGPAELVQLAHTFNDMSLKLRQDAQRIQQQNHAMVEAADRLQLANDEIERFNQELQDRVEQRTAELRAAQARLIDAARFAAVGELGAGLAHELNNPLAGILGLSQLLLAQARADDPLRPLLESMQVEGRRCARIVQTLGRLSEAGERPEGAVGGQREAEVDDVLDDVLPLLRGGFAHRGVSLDRGPRRAWTVGVDPAALGQALAQLLAALRARVAAGGRVHVQVEVEPGAGAALCVRLDGPAPPTDEDDWRAQGMAIWAARSGLSALGGRLEEPDAAAPSRWRVHLPVA